eukprot:symbB.v1.2.016709.t1/scaffold1282.1/size127056/4
MKRRFDLWEFCAPTALIHFLCVELVPVYVIGFYFYNLVVNDGSACFMQVVRREPGFGGRHINHLSDVELQSCVQNAFHNMLVSGQFKIDCIGSQGEAHVDLFDSPFEGNFSDLQALRMAILGTWFTLGMCALLVTYSLLCFAREGSWSFRSAAYLVFTWELEQRRSYRILGFLLAGGIVAMVLHSLMVKSFAKTSMYSVDHVRFLKMQFDLAVVIYSVKLILYPGTPIHRWQHTPISHIRFKRHFVHLFSQSNDKLGAFLLDALWRANHGQMEALKYHMYDPDDAEIFLLLANDQQEAEADERIRFGLCDDFCGNPTDLESDTEEESMKVYHRSVSKKLLP